VSLISVKRFCASSSGFGNASISTLVSAFLYFDVSFMVWVILGPLGTFIGEALHLSATQKGLMTSVPLLGGSIWRPLLGWSTDRFGGRRTGLIGMLLTLLPLLIGWRFANKFTSFCTMGLLLGVAGASFAVALPLASGWFPPERQGIAMGIAGAGNSGTLLATLFAPRLAQMLGWRSVFAVAAIPLLLVWCIFFVLAKDAPVPRRVKQWREYAALFKIGDTGWLCLLYCLTFGGFSGFASYLSIFFHDQYHLTKVQAGDFTTVVVLFGSFLRPVGGFLSDSVGGHRMLLRLMACAGLALGIVATQPPAAVAVCCLAFCMGMLGMGNGAVFQLVPQRFPREVCIMTGLVGAAGGFGGFLLPSVMGYTRDMTGGFTVGLVMVSGAFFAGVFVLLYLGSVWRRTWPADAAERAGLLSSGMAPATAAAPYATD
jgi:NNP family nitrate/nitrite transporter-like MFS transporter